MDTLLFQKSNCSNRTDTTSANAGISHRDEARAVMQASQFPSPSTPAQSTTQNGAQEPLTAPSRICTDSVNSQRQQSLSSNRVSVHSDNSDIQQQEGDGPVQRVLQAYSDGQDTPGCLVMIKMTAGTMVKNCQTYRRQNNLRTCYSNS